MSQCSQKISSIYEFWRVCLGGKLDFELFCEPAFLALHHVGSLVYPSYFLTNYRQACSNRAGFRVIGQFCHSALSHRHVRETQQDAIQLNFLKEKDVLVSRPAGSGKFVNFESFPVIVGVVLSMDVTDGYPYFQGQLSSINEAHCIRHWKFFE